MSRKAPLLEKKTRLFGTLRASFPCSTFGLCLHPMVVEDVYHDVRWTKGWNLDTIKQEKSLRWVIQMTMLSTTLHIPASTVCLCCFFNGCPFILGEILTTYRYAEYAEVGALIGDQFFGLKRMVCDGVHLFAISTTCSVCCERRVRLS